MNTGRLQVLYLMLLTLKNVYFNLINNLKLAFMLNTISDHVNLKNIWVSFCLSEFYMPNLTSSCLQTDYIDLLILAILLGVSWTGR